MSIERISPVISPTEVMKTLELYVDETTGLRIHTVDVPDGYEGSPRRGIYQNALSHFEEDLRENPHITIDSPVNPGRDYLNESETIRSWRSMMPSAMALYPLQRPDKKHLPNGVEVDSLARDLFRHSQDAVGIRTRAEIMKNLVTQSAEPGELEWISLASGAAVPVLDAVSSLPSDTDAQLTLVDYDPVALDFATELATEQGLTPDKDFSIEQRNLVKELIIRDDLVTEKGEESYDMVDMLGIFEYFDEQRGAALLKNAYRLVRPGGKMIIGNMLDTHPTLQLNQRAVGWPGIKPRSIAEIAAIVEAAGIEADDVDVYIPKDGVYAVLDIAKPELTPAAILRRPIGDVALKA